MVEKIAKKVKTEEKTAFPLTKSGSCILRSRHLTEKSSHLELKNIYVFRVGRFCNKIEIKKEVEDKYKVEVTAVRVSRVPATKRFRGRRLIKLPGYKKAMVSLKAGQKLTEK